MRQILVPQQGSGVIDQTQRSISAYHQVSNLRDEANRKTSNLYDKEEHKIVVVLNLQSMPAHVLT